MLTKRMEENVCNDLWRELSSDGFYLKLFHVNLSLLCLYKLIFFVMVIFNIKINDISGPNDKSK